MSRESEIRDAVHHVWRNLPGFPTTFGACGTPGCNGSARGGGICIHCAEVRLADIVGVPLAAGYVAAARKVRDLEAALIAES